MQERQPSFLLHRGREESAPGAGSIFRGVLTPKELRALPPRGGGGVGAGQGSRHFLSAFAGPPTLRASSWGERPPSGLLPRVEDAAILGW